MKSDMLDENILMEDIHCRILDKAMRICRKNCPSYCFSSTHRETEVMKSECLDTILHSALKTDVPMITIAKALCKKIAFWGIEKPISMQRVCSVDDLCHFLKIILKYMLENGLDIKDVKNFVLSNEQTIRFDEDFYIKYFRYNKDNYLTALRKMFMEIGVGDLGIETCKKILSEKLDCFDKKKARLYMACRSFEGIEVYKIPPWLAEIFATQDLNNECGPLILCSLLHYEGTIENIGKREMIVSNILQHVYNKK